MLKFNIIGAGRLGKALAVALTHTKLGLLQGICNRSLSSAEQAVNLLGIGKACSLPDLPKAAITFITIDDDAIPTVAEALAEHAPTLRNSLIVHCSGALSSSVLLPLKKLGCDIASIHPLKSFSQDVLSVNAFNQCPCAVEGDEGAVDYLQPLFTQLGAQVFKIDAAHKSSYHAAAVMASNYLVTLASHAEALFKASGLTPRDARPIIMSLMKSSLDAVGLCNEVKEALTGPLARGDQKTIARHLSVIIDEDVKQLYRAAGMATLPLTPLNDNQRIALKSLLKKPDSTRQVTQ